MGFVHDTDDLVTVIEGELTGIEIRDVSVLALLPVLPIYVDERLMLPG